MRKFKALIMVGLFAVLLTSTVSASFVESIEAKPAPDVVVQYDEDGNSYAAAIVDSDGNVVQTVGTDEIVVTPVSSSTELDAEAQVTMDNAYAQITDASDLSEVCPEIVDVIDQLGLALQDMVVKDLFDLSIPDEVRTLLDEGYSITIAFSLDVAEGQSLVVLHNYEGDSWEAIDPSLVEVKDGVAYVTFTSLSPIAFVVDSTDAGFSDDTSSDATDTQTGDSFNYAVVIVLIASIAVLIVLISKKYLSVKK